MSCTDNTCGTGGYAGPGPGDPDSNSILTATPAFGGIDLNWTPPGLNPHAVAFVRIYRSLADDFNGAVRLTDVGGGSTFYYDKIDTAIRYYYWIEFYSANTGLPGDVIGPATAIARPAINEMIQQLTGQIDAGTLAQSLKTEIDRIALLSQAITQESSARQSYNEALASTLTQVQSALESYSALLQQEVTTRATGQSALVQALTTVQATAADALAAVQTEMQANIDTVGGKVTAIGALYTAKVTVSGPDGTKLIGGFGIYNDGTQVDAGFDVDRFWVGRTGPDKKKPFIISGGEVFINEAVIEKLTFDKLRAADGSFIVQDGKVKAQYLQVQQIMGGAYTGWGWPSGGQTGFYLGPEGLLMGNYYSGKYFEVTSGGDIYAPGLTIVNGVAAFSGTLTAAAVNAVNTINIAGQAVTIPVFSEYTSAYSFVGGYDGTGPYAPTSAAGEQVIDLASAVITSSGAPMVVTFSTPIPCTFKDRSGWMSYMGACIRVDGVTYKWLLLDSPSGSYSSGNPVQFPSVSSQITLPAGTHTISISIVAVPQGGKEYYRNIFTVTAPANRSVLLLEVKR